MPAFDPGPAALSAPASVFEVVRFDRSASGADRFQPLPNVCCEAVHVNEGAVPSAQFRYALGSADPSSPFPYLWEDLWPLDASGPYVVADGDELLVYEAFPDGSRVLRFDGFATLPQVDHGGSLDVSFVASGVGVRLWDDPVADSLWRDASDPLHGAEVVVPGSCWFNRDNRPNRSPSGYDFADGDKSYPVFVDPDIPSPEGADPVVPDFWTLADLVNYLFARHNTATDPAGKPWVADPVSPTGDDLADYLKSVAPLDGQEFYDLTDPSTYQTKDVVVRSFDALTMALPDAVFEQLGYYGFRACFACREDPSDPGAPLNELFFYRVDGRDANAPKSLYYPPEGAALDGGIPDFHASGVARDGVSPVNEFQVISRADEYEASFVLACGFEVAAGDAGSANIKTFDASALADADADARKKYRYFVLDEAGLGHWDWATSAWVTEKAPDLDELFGPPETAADGTSLRRYVDRLRGPIGTTLFSLDPAGNPRRAELAVSRDYDPANAKAVPGLWDGTGTWRSLGGYGWRADWTAVAVWLTAQNPEKWEVVKADDSIVPGDVLRVITSLAAPAGKDTRFWLRLTCAVRADAGISAVAKRRTASPSRFTSRRVVDAKDHWVVNFVHASSRFSATPGKTVAARDDTDKAQAHADALRDAREFPEVAGSFTLPGIRDDVGVGDFIDRIDGRGVSLDTAAGTQAGESPRYPVVVGFTWLPREQATTFKLSDRRAEPESSTHDRRSRRR